MKSKNDKSFHFPKINFHIIFFLVMFVIVALIIWRILNYGVHINPDDYDGPDETEIDALDNIVPLIIDPEDNPANDGITTIVAFGNAPFADDRDSEDSLANIIARMTNAVVYNCAVSGSYLTAEEETLLMDEAPMDAFNFYWLTTVACMNGYEKDALTSNYDHVFRNYGDILPQDAKEAYDTLTSIDFNKVDDIVVMYDASDYLAGHTVFSEENSTDINTFTGNLEAGLDLLRATYPHIRLIVLSPSFAYAINEKGEYVSSEIYHYGNDVLSTYMIKEGESCYFNGITFIDNLFGTVHEYNADDYLTDNLHLNAEGRKRIAERFKYALEW